MSGQWGWVSGQWGWMSGQKGVSGQRGEEADPPPPPEIAIAAVNTHPTGMHSCYSCRFFSTYAPFKIRMSRTSF